MKRLLILIMVAGVPLYGQNTSVLFLGNSYTAYNNLPSMVAQLALSAGDTISYDSNTPGGYTLQLHSQNSTTITKINSQPWNFVVIQAQSQEPALDTPSVVNNVFPYARALDSMVELNDNCTQVVFYMTWGRKYGDATNCANYPPVCTYSGMQDQLRGRYLQMAADNDAMVAPVGAAWQNVIATNPAFDLFDTDNSHPSLHGSYLAACVFYSTIYRRSSAGLTYYGGIPVADAQLLQNIASATVLDSMLTWRTETYFPIANFTFTGSGNAITCTADSANTYAWCDGLTTAFVPGAQAMSFTYPGQGTYEICLAVSNACGRTDTICQLIPVGSLGIDQAKTANPEIFFDPLSRRLKISGDGEFQLEIVSASGQRFLEAKIVRQGEVLMDELPVGIYYCILQSTEAIFAKPVVITMD